jgi:catechol 2,3-dioxygenase-like lactoylglutathione lyase family enzyme
LGATSHVCEETDMIKGIKFASIPVRDQDRALAFWRDQIGLAVATDQPMGKQRWIELRIPGADTRLVLFTPRRSREPHRHGPECGVLD